MKGRRDSEHPGNTQAGGVARIAAHLARLLTINGWALYVLLAAALAFSLLARFYEPFPGDVSLILWVQTWRHPVTTAFVKALAQIGRPGPMIGLAGVAVVGLFVLRRRRECFAAAGALGLLGLTPILQMLVNRARPPADLLGIGDPFAGFSFPSGHTFQTFVLFGFLIYLATILISRMWLRRSVQMFLAFLILAMGFSRVYLGAHWPSDVLGSYLLGGSFLALLLRLCQTELPRVMSRKGKGDPCG